MSSSFKNLKFNFSWRPYQAKVLNNFDDFIKDNHFHIIAPPGSGKTILGIELIRRVNKKTLVLSPTITIRNQWESRLQEFFTKNKSFKEFSFDIKKPSTVTFSTYQSLHALYKSFNNVDDYFLFFKNNNIEVLVLDEAHHLKNEWWKCLFNLKEQHNKTVIALTATPPYDSTNVEMKKYFSLCGKIDDEIVVPDLIKEKNLCPHQDLIYLSKPLKHEINALSEYVFKVASFIKDLVIDLDFIEFLKSHRFFKETKKHINEIYKNSDYFSAILIFLNEASGKISREKLLIIGFEKKEAINFPKISVFWIEILLQNILVFDRESLIDDEIYLITLEKRLKRINAYSNRKVNLSGTESLFKSLNNSPSKLKSISKIVNHEQNNLKNDLRCVILSDYIRKEFLNTPNSEVDNINKIGIVPIFHHLRKYTNKKEIAVLTGSLIIIHNSIVSKLKSLDENKQLKMNPLLSDSKFLTISLNKGKNDLVNIITQLFEEGYIKVLIGTKSLLGEGWDAPSINSLILATSVGSFVTSNQVRGRAIRINSKNPNKVGVIWHLACIDFSVENGGKDLEILSRRFKAFLGVSNTKKAIITNGLERLNLPKFFDPKIIDEYNSNNLKQSKQREHIKNKWDTAIDNGKSILQEIVFFNRQKNKSPKQETNETVSYTNLSKKYYIILLIAILLFIPNIFNTSFFLLKNQIINSFLIIISVLILLFGFKIYKTIKLYFRYEYIYKRIYKIALTIIDTLEELHYLNTSKEDINLNVNKLDNGNISCQIEGVNRFENTLFINALNEVLQPIHNPKYLIIKKTWFREKPKIENLFSIPEIFEETKTTALMFKNNWDKNIEKSELIYTRNIEGRKLLLKARIFNIQNFDKKTSKKNTVWK